MCWLFRLFQQKREGVGRAWRSGHANLNQVQRSEAISARSKVLLRIFPCYGEGGPLRRSTPVGPWWEGRVICENPTIDSSLVSKQDNRKPLVLTDSVAINSHAVIHGLYDLHDCNYMLLF